MVALDSSGSLGRAWRSVGRWVGANRGSRMARASPRRRRWAQLGRRGFARSRGQFAILVEIRVGGKEEEGLWVNAGAIGRRTRKAA